MNLINTVIFDFDQTIADTSSLQIFRESKNWKKVYENINSIKIYDGMFEVFSFLKSNNFKIGIVTSSPSKYCILALKFLKLNSDIIVGYHDTSLRKPSPDPVILAIKKLNSNPYNCIGIGDNISDMLAYNSAGIISVATLWSFKDAVPNFSYTLDYPAALINLLTHLNHKK